MSKDQKKTVEIDVEIVDNWIKKLSYITTTITFWKKNNEWPINLCMDVLEAISNQIYEIIIR